MMPMTKWVKRLLIANVVVFLASQVYPQLYALQLVPRFVLYRPWTVVTYMFLHANWTHILFNMLGLFFFGPRVEMRLGEKRFLWLYFLSGLGGAAGSFVFPDVGVIGASAAVFGVLVAFAMYWPREKVLLFFIIPMDAWLLVVGYVAVELYMGVTGTEAHIAHFAHLGGVITGFLYLKWSDWRMGASKRAFQRAMSPQPAAGSSSDRGALERWRTISVDGLHELNREEVARLLDKAERMGPRSLTDVEREFMDRMSGR